MLHLGSCALADICTRGLQSIDSKEVSPANLIPLLRGNDMVGSQVQIVVKKAETSQTVTFNLQRWLPPCVPHACTCHVHTHTHKHKSLSGTGTSTSHAGAHRSDIRSVEKMKDLFMKLAELQAESRAPRQEKVEAISKALEAQTLIVTDWAAVVEDSLRSHNEDLEQLVAEYMGKHQQAVEESNKYLQEGTAVRKELLAAQQEREVVQQELEYTKKAAGDKHAQLEAEIARLQAQAEKARQAAFDQLQAERDRAATELQQLRERMSKELADADSRGSKDLADRLDSERQRHDMELKQLRSDMESASKRAAADILALETELASARSQIEQLKKELADMTHRTELSEANVRHLERDVEQSRHRSQDLQQALTDSALSLEQTRDALRSLEQVYMC